MSVGTDTSTLKRCSRCREEKPVTAFHRRRHRNGRVGPTSDCAACRCAARSALSKTPRGRENNRKNASRHYYRLRARAQMAGKLSPAEVDAIRKAMIEAPKAIDDDEAAAAYYRGFLAGAGRAQSEAAEVEEMKDLVFRIAQELNQRFLGARQRLTYEDMVSHGYEALLECLRKKRRERPLVASAIRRRIVDATRERFGRRWEKPGEATGMHGEEEGVDRIANIADERPEGLELLEDVFAALPDERTREIVRRRAAGESLREIGDSLGIHESRVCQLFGEAKPLVAAALGIDLAEAAAASVLPE